MTEQNAAAGWTDAGAVGDFRDGAVTEVDVLGKKVAVSRVGDVFGAISGVCNHVGGPLGQGTLDGEYVVCPWHHWKFHRVGGQGEPGFEEDCVPRHDVRVEGGRVLVSSSAVSGRKKKPHAKHSLARAVEREPGPVRVLGISTTAMDEAHPRVSTSELLLDESLRHAADALGAETQLLRLSELSFRACEGYYSKSAHACTWPCSITQMDEADQMDRVYEGIVHWADVLILATPIRWGSASSLYFKMIERLNCVQNQITIRNNVLIRNKVASFIVTGGQDNVQGTVGQLLTFFSELGFEFPQFPFIGHSRGWSAEDMERNVAFVHESAELKDGAKELAARSVAKAASLLAVPEGQAKIPRGGRKAHRLEVLK